MIIDCTTKNKVYCPTSPQGQWFNHRFGKRDYPELDVDYEVVEKVVGQYIGLPFLAIFASKYGDPIYWPHIKETSDYLENWMRIESYGMGDVNDYFYCSRNFSELVIKLDGMGELCGKVHLGSNWDHIDEVIRTLKNFKKPDLVFDVYEHNKHQIPAIIDYAEKQGLKLTIQTPAEKTEPHGSCIINQHKEWLYDVIPHRIDRTLSHKQLKENYSNLEPVDLKRHLVGYNSIRLYTQIKQGRNILEHPMIPAVDEEVEVISHKVVKARETHIWVTPTGHCFHTADEYSMFMYMLGREWALTQSELAYFERTRSGYVKTVLAYANALSPEILDQVKVKLP